MFEEKEHVYLTVSQSNASCDLQYGSVYAGQVPLKASQLDVTGELLCELE